tara:strand:- start:304 stop:483 length:180 start_codon:yes stop_codon:yes gene_type:complete
MSIIKNGIEINDDSIEIDDDSILCAMCNNVATEKLMFLDDYYCDNDCLNFAKEKKGLKK